MAIRCQSCGAGLSVDGQSVSAGKTVSCGYCGASFILPDPETDPDLYDKTYQTGYDVEGNQEHAEAIQWVRKQKGGFSLSDFGTSLDFSLIISTIGTANTSDNCIT